MLPLKPLGGAFVEPIFKFGRSKSGRFGTGMVSLSSGHRHEGGDPGGVAEGLRSDRACPSPEDCSVRLEEGVINFQRVLVEQ